MLFVAALDHVTRRFVYCVSACRSAAMNYTGMSAEQEKAMWDTECLKI